MNKNKLKIFIMTFIISTFLLFLGTTYAYFRTIIKENNNKTSIDVSTKVLEVKYTDGTAEFFGSSNGFVFPGDSFRKYWTVENTGEDTAEFDIILRNISNTFERKQDWTYQLGVISDLNSDGIVNTLEEITFLTQGPIQFPDTSEKVIIYPNRSLEFQETESYVLIIEYVNSEEDQSIDMNKNLTATIDIASSEAIITE